MAKNVNDLSEKDFAKAERQLLSLLLIVNANIFRFADDFGLDRNEAYSWLLSLMDGYAGRDLSKRRGITIKQGLRIIREFLDIGKECKDG